MTNRMNSIESLKAFIRSKGAGVVHLRDVRPCDVAALPEVAKDTGCCFVISCKRDDDLHELEDVLILNGAKFQLQKSDEHGQPVIVIGGNLQSMLIEALT